MTHFRRLDPPAARYREPMTPWLTTRPSCSLAAQFSRTGAINATTVGNMVPPRDPDDDYEDEHEENEGRNEDLDPAVIREPDE